MRLAVIADIHGNLEALKAVLADISGRNIDKICCAGDLVGYGPFPNEVIELIRREGIPTVLGNYDDAVAYSRPMCGCAFPDARARELGEQSLVWTQAHTTEANKAFLRGLPRELRFRAGPYEVLVVHGSPRFLDEYLYEDAPTDLLQEIFTAHPVDILVVGHTHKPYHRVFGGRHIINAGSAGKPKDRNPAAAYALIEIGQCVEVTFPRVTYDVACVARAIQEAGLPADFARQLFTAQE
ncbi:MAG: Phosphodiesterase, family [Clostridia bacterium 62_21]|nr:MAG: Phosphodiesterase, family [Clostridia bacterium 62_21]HAG07563.1 YfcE family phosphodiesterase [Peptococcaceae bacterium]